MAISSKMTDDLDGCGHIVVVRNGKEGGLGVHRYVPYEFAITLSCQNVADTFFAPPVESMSYAALGCAKERVHKS